MKKFILVGLIALGLVACDDNKGPQLPSPDAPTDAEVVCEKFDGSTENLVEGEWYTFDTDNGVVSVCRKKEATEPVVPTVE